MQRINFLTIIFCSFLAFTTMAHSAADHAYAQEAEEQPLQVSSEWVIPSSQPPTENILFLIDGSGSMSGDKIDVAINFAMEIAGAPVDDLQIALVTFGSSVSRWEGMEDINPTTGEPISRPGWAVMPSADNLAAAQEWLSQNLDMGSTNIRPGLNHSFASCSGGEDPLHLYSHTIENLTIIILTDGQFSDNMDAEVDGSGILATVAFWQKQRTDSGLNEAVVGVIGINSENNGRNNLEKLAGNLGFLSLTFDKE